MDTSEQKALRNPYDPGIVGRSDPENGGRLRFYSRGVEIVERMSAPSRTGNLTSVMDILESPGCHVVTGLTGGGKTQLVNELHDRIFQASGGEHVAFFSMQEPEINERSPIDVSLLGFNAPTWVERLANSKTRVIIIDSLSLTLRSKTDRFLANPTSYGVESSFASVLRNFSLLGQQVGVSFVVTLNVGLTKDTSGGGDPKSATVSAVARNAFARFLEASATSLFACEGVSHYEDIPSLDVHFVSRLTGRRWRNESVRLPQLGAEASSYGLSFSTETSQNLDLVDVPKSVSASEYPFDFNTGSIDFYV